MTGARIPGFGSMGSGWYLEVHGRVVTRVTMLITLIRGLITPLITTPEHPSRDVSCKFYLIRAY